MAVTCPLCFKKGKQSKVKCFQINLTEAMVLCENKECSFPLLEGSLTRIVKRDIQKIEDEGPAPPASEDIASESTVHASECSSQNESNICNETDDGSRCNTHMNALEGNTNEDGSSIIATTTSDELEINSTMSSTHTPDTEIPDFNKFEFKSPPAVGNGVKKKKKPKRYFTGRTKRKPKKKSTKVQNGSSN